MFANPRDQAQRDRFRENVRRRTSVVPSTSDDTLSPSSAMTRNLAPHQEELLQTAMAALAQFVASKDSGQHDVNRPIFEREATGGSDLSAPMLGRHDSAATVSPLDSHGREPSMPLSVTSGTLNEFRQSPGLRDFESIIDDLKSALSRLEHALRTVGSGGPAMYAADMFRNSLRRMLSLFHKHHQLFSSIDDAAVMPDAVLEGFKSAFGDLSIAAQHLHSALMDYVGMTYNEALMTALYKLQRRSERVQTGQSSRRHKRSKSGHHILDTNFTEQGHAVPDYLRDVIPDFERNFREIKDSLEDFIRDDIQAIRAAQQDQTSRFVNLTVLATLLSSVTASMLQVEGPGTQPQTVLEIIVSITFFSSLVLSTACAAQSLLTMTWILSFVQHPERFLIPPAYFWLNRGPIISLLGAGALFSLGLALYVYSSHQHPATLAITTFAAAAETAGVLGLAVAFYYAKWRFRVDHGATGLKMTRASLPFLAIDVLILIVRASRRWVAEMCCCCRRKKKGPLNDKGAIGGTTFVGVDEEADAGEKRHHEHTSASRRGSKAEPIGDAETLDETRSMVESIGHASEVSRANSELGHFGFSKSLAAIIRGPKAAIQNHHDDSK